MNATDQITKFRQILSGLLGTEVTVLQKKLAMEQAGRTFGNGSRPRHHAKLEYDAAKTHRLTVLQAAQKTLETT